MNEKMLVTPLGHMLLTQRKEQLEKMILETQEGLVELNEGDTGDGFQDGYLWETQTDIQIMTSRLREIDNILKDAVLTMEPQPKEAVSLGHKALLSLTYPSGESETLNVVLASSSELPLIEEYLQNGEVPISPHSALGKAIFGKRVGTEFQYVIEAGTVQGQLLQVEIWQPAFPAVAVA